MISKDYRLKENEVKKVLKYGKPFFSYLMVLNYNKNNLKYNRFAIIISSKNADSSVKRNFFRRIFYRSIELSVIVYQKNFFDELKEIKLTTESGELKAHYDLVFVLKKQTKLEKNNLESINGFDHDVKFLLKKFENI